MENETVHYDKYRENEDLIDILNHQLFTLKLQLYNVAYLLLRLCEFLKIPLNY